LSKATTATAPRLAGHSTIAAAAVVVSFLVFGALEGLAAGNRPASFFLSVFHYVLIAAAFFAWASCDSSLNGRQLSGAMAVCLVLFGFLAVPFYLAGYRSEPHWFRWWVKGLAVLAACGVSFVFLFDLLAQSRSGI
jgi:hypothetical protein